ncbi:MAG: hypothetical protein WBZ20_19110 [Nitrososphaeraceae archaeon]
MSITFGVGVIKGEVDADLVQGQQNNFKAAHYIILSNVEERTGLITS